MRLRESNTQVQSDAAPNCERDVIDATSVCFGEVHVRLNQSESVKLLISSTNYLARMICARALEVSFRAAMTGILSL